MNDYTKAYGRNIVMTGRTYVWHEKFTIAAKSSAVAGRDLFQHSKDGYQLSKLNSL